MTAKQFILKRNFTVALTKKEEETYFTSMLQPSEYLKLMDEYASYVLSVAVEKAEIAIEETADNPYDHYIIVDKDSILNCLKD